MSAKVTSKGQITVPKIVRDTLDIKKGDELLFRIEPDRVVISRTPDFLTLAGSIGVPASKRNVAWDQVLKRTRSERAAKRA